MGSTNNETSYLSDGILSNSVTGGGCLQLPGLRRDRGSQRGHAGRIVEYQQAQGGVMNMVTKAGTNKFRADAMHYWAPAEIDQRADHAAVQLPRLCPGRAPDSSCTSTVISATTPEGDLEGPHLVLRRREQRRPELQESRAARHRQRIPVGLRRVPLEPQVHGPAERQDELQPGGLLRVVALDEPAVPDGDRPARNAVSGTPATSGHSRRS